MRIRFFTTLSVVFIGLLSHAQLKVEPCLKVESSEEISAKKGTFFRNLGVEGERILLETYMESELVLTTLDAKTLSVKDKQWIKKNNVKNYPGVLSAKEWGHNGTIFFGDRSISFFQSFNKANSNHTLMAGKIAENGELDKKLRIIGEQSAKNRIKHGNFTVVPSVDSTHLLVAYSMLAETKKDDAASTSKFMTWK